MNERIEKLLEQCNYPVDGTCDLSREVKFAELIVNECASLLPETDGDIGGTYRDKIKEHFGVE